MHDETGTTAGELAQDGSLDDDIGAAEVDPPAQDAPTVTQRLSLATILVIAAGVAFVGSVMLGVAEFVLAWYASSASSDSASWPGDIILAGAGQAVVTHLMFWLVILAVCGVLYWLIAGRRAAAAPEVSLITIFIALAAVLVMPVDLAVANLNNPAVVGAAVILGWGFATGVYFLLRVIRRRWGAGRLRRCYHFSAIAAAAATLILGTVFFRSPFANPAAFHNEITKAATARHGRPNVLWIVLDTVRADRMSVYGYDVPTTPFLEEWSQNCIVIERAVANGNWTLPCHASMFTGLPVRSHGFGLPAGQLDKSFRTVAEVLRENGYTIGLFSNNVLVAPKTELSRGFETPHVVAHFRSALAFSLSSLLERWGITPPLPWLDSDFGAALTHDLLGRWLDNHQNEPFFVFVNLMEAHLPYRVPRRYREAFMSPEQVRRSYDLRRSVYGNIAIRLNIGALIDGYDHMLMSDREVIKRQYESAIRYLVDRVREMIDVFRQRGLLDNTLVVITSDHGEYLDTHQMWSHHFQLYRDVIHVPMIIREPGRRDSRRVDALVQLSDLYPTVLRYVLGPEAAETSIYAQDMFEVAERGGDERIAISEAYPCEPATMERLLAKDDPQIRHRASPQVTAIGSRFKYIDSSDGMRELYDLDNDSGELDNLVYSHRREGQRLANYLKWWLKTTPVHKPSEEAESIYSPEVIDALKALGYIGDDP